MFYFQCGRHLTSAALFICDNNRCWDTRFPEENSFLILLPVLVLDHSMRCTVQGPEKKIQDIFYMLDFTHWLVSAPVSFFFSQGIPAFILTVCLDSFPCLLSLLCAFHPLPPPTFNRYAIMMKWHSLPVGLMPCLKLNVRPRLIKSKRWNQRVILRNKAFIWNRWGWWRQVWAQTAIAG